MPVELLYNDSAYRTDDLALREGNNPSLLENAAQGVGLFGANVAAFGTVALGGITRALNEPEGDRILKFYDSHIAPVRKAFTPDPETTGFAGKILHGLGTIGGAALTGPAAPFLLTASQSFGEGIDLVDKGVDPNTAALGAATTAAFTGAQVYLPLSAKTLPKTAAMVAAGDVVGMAERGAMKYTLSNAGYHELARNYDPFALDAIAIDTLMGSVFGLVGHRATKKTEKAFQAEKRLALDAYQERLNTLPLEAQDAVNVIRQHQQVLKDLPFDPKSPNAIRDHLSAVDKALQDLSEGRAVDVQDVVKTHAVADIANRKTEADTPVAEAIKTADKVLKAAEPAPVETTVREEWGTSPMMQSGKAEIIRDLIKGRAEKQPLENADIQQLQFLRDRLATSEGPSKIKDPETGQVIANTGSGYPEWFQSKGYKQKETLKMLDAAIEGKALTQRQHNIVTDLLESSGREYGKAKPLVDSYAARNIEEMFSRGEDLPGEFIGVNKDGSPEFASARAKIEALKADIRKTEQMEGAFNRIAKCVIGG